MHFTDGGIFISAHLLVGIKLFVLPLVDNGSIRTIKQEEELLSTLNKKSFTQLLKKKSQILSLTHVHAPVQ